MDWLPYVIWGAFCLEWVLIFTDRIDKDEKK
jgi:hypothetical protein